MTKDEFNEPEGNLLHVTEDCGEDNGTTIKVPIKDGVDATSFMVEINKQLAYFPTIHVNNDPLGANNKPYFVNETLNGHKIIESDLWKYTTSEPVQEMHISLNNVL